MLELDIASLVIGALLGAFFLNLDIRVPKALTDWVKSLFAAKPVVAGAAVPVAAKPSRVVARKAPAKSPIAKQAAPAKKTVVKKK